MQECELFIMLAVARCECFLLKCRYWEAIRKFDEAISVTPNDAALFEMKAQALLILNEVFPAVQAAQRAVDKARDWSAAYQTLGRCQLALGEIKLAAENFTRAQTLAADPADAELVDDLHFAQELERRVLTTTAEQQEAVCEPNCVETEVASGQLKSAVNDREPSDHQ